MYRLVEKKKKKVIILVLNKRIHLLRGLIPEAAWDLKA